MSVSDRRGWFLRPVLLIGLVALLATGLILTTGAPSGADAGDAPITGAIHVDYDRDGTIDPGEESLVDRPALTLTASDGAGLSAPCVLSAADASYECDVTTLGAGPFVLELNAGDGFSDSFTGPDYGPLVQQVEAGGSTNFGIVPVSQCANSLYVPCFVNGDHAAPGGYQDTLVSLPYLGGAPTVLATKAQTGATWGVAYDEWESVLYTSSFLKRHADFGPDGGGAVYWTADNGGTWNTIDLTTALGLTPISRDLDGVSGSETSYDAEAFGLVGKYGMGDIDLTPDGNTLIVSDLGTSTVHAVDVTAIADGGAASPLSAWAIGANGCAGSHQIFATKALDAGNALVGVTCTGPTVADLAAKIVNLDLASGAQNVVLDVPLQYARPCPGNDTLFISFDLCNSVTPNGDTIVDGSWLPWSDDYADFGVIERNGSAADVLRPQAILSDIEVTADGGFVLGLIDRGSHQLGNRNCIPIDGAPCLEDAEQIKSIQIGDILRVCNTGTLAAPSYAIEGQAGCATNFATEPVSFPTDPAIENNNGRYRTGPFSADGEFFDDVFNIADIDTIGTPHGETAGGGLFIAPYSDLVVSSALNPETTIGSGGVKWFDANSGAAVNGQNLYVGVDNPDDGLFAKAAGIGDIEGCLNPIQIGDFVWFDTNRNGIQDGGEPAISGVTVTMTDVDGLSVTTTTDANGYYTFGPADGVTPGATYSITFDVLGADKTIGGLPSGVTPADLVPTIADAAGASDLRDSDAASGKISVTVGESSDHSLDAGFTTEAPPVYDLALNITGDQPLVTVGDTVKMTVNVENQGEVSSGDYEVIVFVPEGFALAPGADADWSDNGDGTATYVGGDAGKLEVDESTSLSLLLIAEAPGAKAHVFAEISEDSGDDVDSTPDAVNGGFEESPLETDDSLTAASDDHDFESITATAAPIYDLALNIVPGPDQGTAVLVGDDVLYHINVENQGTESSGDYEIVVYIPAGLELNDPDWTDNGDGTATYVGGDAVKLEADDEVKIPVNFTATDAGSKEHVFAEIAGDSGDDVDSTPDADNGLFIESPLPTNDSLLDAEDDHDFETITVSTVPVYDLALNIKPGPDQSPSVTVGDDVVYHVTVVNQGTEPSGDYEIVVYIPVGLELNDPDWTDNGDGTATYTGDDAGELDSGDDVKIPVTFTATDAGSKDHVFAEISEDSGDDVDSTPDATNGGFDESPLDTDDSLVAASDDHDFATITVVEPIATVVVPSPTPEKRIYTITATPVPTTVAPIIVTATPVPVVVPKAKATATAEPAKKDATPATKAAAKTAAPLAVTGSSSAMPVLLASFLLVAGGLILLLSRRERA